MTISRSNRKVGESVPSLFSLSIDMDAPQPSGTANATIDYHPLEQDTIRLVRFQPWSTSTDIHCSMSHQYGYFNAPVKYMALSYCWGQAEHKRQITLNGRPHQVTANLWDALAALWKHDAHIPFWVDAICINQQDVVERNAQVQQMWRIFGSAHRVDVWLGPGLVPDSPVPTSDGSMGEEVRTQQLLRMLSATQYFTRTWVIPEVLQARAIFVLCGDECIPWSEFSLPIVLWASRHDSNNEPSIVQLRRLFEARWDVHGAAGGQEPHMQFMKVVYLYIIGNCRDPRDKIFALLGHPLIRKLGDLIDLRVDYRLSIEELALAVLAQYRRLDLQKSYKDTDGPLAKFWAHSYDTLMLWLQDMLQMTFASAAFGDVLKKQIVELTELKTHEQTCYLALLTNEEILLTGDLLLHIGKLQGDGSASTRCRICSAVRRAQRAVDEHGCAAASHPSQACDQECQRRHNLLQCVLEHSLQSPDQQCIQCAFRFKVVRDHTSPIS